jgi:ribosomal protein S18 acetylase RimI-like enzyme
VEIRAATASDLDDVFDLLTVRSRAAFGISEVRRDHLAQTWTLSGTDRFVASGNGALAGYASLDSAGDVGFAGVDAAALDGLLETVESRARGRGLAHLTAIVVPEDEPYDALVRRGGFDLRGEVLRMWRDLALPADDPVWPNGVHVRSYEKADARRVQSLLDEAYLAWDPAYSPKPHEDWVQWMTGHDEFDPELWLLAERDGDLVACGLHWKEHQQRGWVKDLVVREDERGRGLAKALLHEAFRSYRERGATRVGLKVEATNPTGAPQLYARVGFETDRRYGTWVKEL